MASSFLRRVVPVANAKRKVAKPLTPAARPSIESLDHRILPTVTAQLNPRGLLKVIADTHHGTSQVEIVQSAGQILVEDGGRVVNGFDPTQVQQIDVKYREGQQQHARIPLNIPVNQQQMTLTGIAVGEVDLNIGAGSMSAAVSAALADGTAVSLAGPVDGQGNYDLTGTADISVAGFTLPGAAFELTPAGMAVSGTAAVGGASVNLAGAVDGQGNYDLTGRANVTVDGFALDAGLELTNTGLTAAAALAFGSDVIQFAGTVDAGGRYNLTGTGHVTVGGFGGEVNLTLTNTSLTGTDTVNVPNVGNVVFSGLGDPHGLNLTASVPVVLAGFASMGNANLALNNAGLMVSTAMNLQLATVDLSGPMQPDGQFSLTGTANIGMGGSPAHFTLGNSGCTVTATVNVIVATVDFSGSVNPNGSYQLTGTASAAFAGFSGSGTFTLSNTGLTFAGNVNLVVATVACTGAIDSHGNFQLAGSAGVGLGGFAPAPASFTLTNSGATLSANINVVIATVAFTGTVDTHGNYNLAGAASVSFAGFPAATTSFVLSSNTGVTLSAAINVLVATANFMGTLDTHGNYRLTATATVGLAGFPAVPVAFVLTNSGCALSGNFNLGPVVPLTGTVSPNGQYRLTGTANVSFAGFAPATTSFVLTNSGLAISANINVTVGTVAFTGSLSPSGQYQLTASAHISLAGFGASATLTLTNRGLNAAGTLDLAVMGFRLAFNGLIASNGSFSFTAGTNINFGPITSTLTLTLTNSGFSAAVHASDDVSTTVTGGGGVWSQRVSYRGSFDVSFAIATNGTYGASGTFTMNSYEGGTPSQTIHYSITTHQFVVKNSEIGFSLWGMAFNPYPDAVDNY